MTDTNKQAPSPAAAPAAASPVANPQGRRKGLTLVAAAVAVAAVAWGGWHWMVARNYQTTDNAYVAGNVVQITPQIGGTVISIGADDTDYVKPGQLLVQLDSADALVALSQAESQLAQTVRQVRSEEHTSELQSPCNLVCRLLLEKKKKYLHSKTRLLPVVHALCELS